MAIKNRGISSNGKREMTMVEFKRWLKKFDDNKDGRISKDELQDAVYANGGWFSKWKSARGLRSADDDQNGFIEDNEMNNLVEFAEKHLGITIVSF